MKASQTETVIMLTCCALQSACYSPTGIVISFILAQFQGEVQTNLTVKRFLMCSAALCTSIAEELFIISRLSRSAERSKRIFTGGVVEENGICSAAFCESAALRVKVSACRKRAKTLRWARGREGCSDSPLPTSGLHPPRNGPRAARP